MPPRGRRWDAIKFIDVNLIKEHPAMKTILAIDLGKRNSVFLCDPPNLGGKKVV